MCDQYHRYSPLSHLQKIWTNGEMRVVGLLQPQHILGTFLHSCNACQYYSETKEQMIGGGKSCSWDRWLERWVSGWALQDLNWGYVVLRMDELAGQIRDWLAMHHKTAARSRDIAIVCWPMYLILFSASRGWIELTWRSVSDPGKAPDKASWW